MDTDKWEDSINWVSMNATNAIVFESGSESEYNPNMSDLPKNYIYPIVIVLAIISCLLITASIFSQRTLRSPYFYVILSWVIANVLHVTIILSIEWMEFRQENWTLGESGCRAVSYLRMVFLYVKAYHMPLAVIIACLSSKIERRFSERPWAAILVPIIACSCIWTIVLLACIPYIGKVELVEAGALDSVRYYCAEISGQFHTAFYILMFVYYILPVVLSLALLLLLGCLFIRCPSLFDTPKRQKVEVMSILVIVHAFILANAVYFFVNWYAINENRFTDGTIMALRISRFIHLSDFGVTPCVCLFLPLLRNIFCMPCTLITNCKRDQNQPLTIPLSVDMVEPTVI